MAESRTFDAGLYCLSRRLAQGAIALVVLEIQRIGLAKVLRGALGT